jgi:hypothetical protein
MTNGAPGTRERYCLPKRQQILANAVDCKVLAQAARQLRYMGARAGHVFTGNSAKRLIIGINGDGYIAPMPNGGYCIGAISTLRH